MIKNEERKKSNHSRKTGIDNSQREILVCFSLPRQKTKQLFEVLTNEQGREQEIVRLDQRMGSNKLVYFFGHEKLNDLLQVFPDALGLISACMGSENPKKRRNLQKQLSLEDAEDKVLQRYKKQKRVSSSRY